jgi:hypothetical protein
MAVMVRAKSPHRSISSPRQYYTGSYAPVIRLEPSHMETWFDIANDCIAVGLEWPVLYFDVDQGCLRSVINRKYGHSSYADQPSALLCYEVENS